MRGIDEAALSMLMTYGWPGNVRQLENTVFRAIVLCDGDVLTVDEFPQIASLVEGFEAKVPPAPALEKKPPQQFGHSAMIGGEALPSAAPVAGVVGDGMALGIPVVTAGATARPSSWSPTPMRWPPVRTGWST